MKDIPGFEGYYQINEKGEIFSLERTVIRSDGRIKKFKARKLKCPNRNGYYAAGLSKNGKIKILHNHRIVAKLWVPNPNNRPQVNHKDLNKTNNHFSNLEWVTIGENIRHYISLGRKPSKRWLLILCLRTGIYYGSLGQAAKARGLKLNKNYLTKHDLLYCGNTVY